MKYIEHAKEGLLNLYFSKLRSVLALLGVLVGTASVVAMVLGGELATNEALRQFKSLGTDLFAVSINSKMQDKPASSGTSDHLTLPQALSLVKADSAIIEVAPFTQTYYPMAYQGQPLNGLILGVTHSFANITQIKIQKGRQITLADNYAFYCVIGQELYKKMKRISYHDPIGQQLQIGKHIFLIVGVAQPWTENSFIYANIDNAVLVPLLASTAISKYATINNVIMRLVKDADLAIVQEHVNTLLNDMMADKLFSFRSAKELIAKMRKQSDILTVFLGLIGSVSLIVGGIGVMNIMLVSVIERRREIGIRLAVGAKRSDIAGLFLVEAVMLSLLGGVLGVVIGILIAYIIAVFWHWQFTLFWWPPLAGFSVSVAVGVFFGFYPAYQASRLRPIEALRSE